VFKNCIFHQCNISNYIFREVTFIDCDCSLVTAQNTVFNDIQFINCKLLGFRFEACNPFLFSVAFENSYLKLSTFIGQKLKKTSFTKCNLQEVDFTEADLTSSVFDECDLLNAIFYKSIVEHVDFRTSYHFNIDPELNKIKKAKFSLNGTIGLLSKYNIIIE
jgi:uncharacterized protein YjbI with pentapeptide repeats